MNKVQAGAENLGISPHKSIGKIDRFIVVPCYHQADCPLYLHDSMAVHDTECPYWHQVN